LSERLGRPRSGPAAGQPGLTCRRHDARLGGTVTHRKPVAFECELRQRIQHLQGGIIPGPVHVRGAAGENQKPICVPAALGNQRRQVAVRFRRGPQNFYLRLRHIPRSSGL
jgi:hypothetical protein